MADMAFFIDTTKCIGCKACQVACKQWNNLPSDKTDFSFENEFTHPAKLSPVTFNHVIFSNISRVDDSKPSWQMMHKKCFHCEEPNCMKVCPAEAIYKNDYWVVINQEKCIGCGECEKACVYHVPQVNREYKNEYGTGKFIQKDKAYKCHACSLDKREIPACVEICPGGAITFDYRIKIAAIAKKRLKDIRRNFHNASIYGLNEFGGMHVITILKDNPEKFGLKVNPMTVNSDRTERINEIYRSLTALSLGLPSLKRFIYKMTKSFMS